MTHLKFHQLEYFWLAAREGGVVRAARVMGVAQPTVSAQIRELERALGAKLFERRGRGIALTTAGRTAYRYADELFALGRDLITAVQAGATAGELLFAVGIAEAVPKLVAHALLKPALALPERVRLACREGTCAELVSSLGSYDLDVVLADEPIGSGPRIRAFSHLLGECGVALYGHRGLVDRYADRFPLSLDGAPFLLPSSATSLRRSVDLWCDAQSVRPRIVGEFDDFALLKVFAEHGAGVFPAPTLVETELQAAYGVRRIGPVAGAVERYFAISVERKLKHPAVLAIVQNAARRFAG